MPTETADWIVMLYMNAESEGFDVSFNKHQFEITRTGSSDRVKIFLLVDWKNSDGTLSNTPKVYLAGKEEITRESISAPLDLDENIGSPEVLRKFVDYCCDQYHAKNTILIFWDHGGGNLVTGGEPNAQLSYLKSKVNKVVPKRGSSIFKFPFSTKDNFARLKNVSDYDYLHVREIYEGIKSSYDPNKKMIDVIGFDACWMQMFENSYCLKGVADYIVASENLISFEGFGYYLFIKELVANPELSPLQVAELLIKSTFLKSRESIRKDDPDYLEKSYNRPYNDPNVTLSCMNLKAVDEVFIAIDQLSLALIENMDDVSDRIKIARFLCLSYFDEQSPAEYDLMVVDLIYFLKKLIECLNEDVPNEKIAKFRRLTLLANKVITLCEFKLIKHREIGSKMSREQSTEKCWGAHGFSIFFPEHLFQWERYKTDEGWYFESDENISMPFAEESQWKKFLITYFDTLKTA